MKKVIFALCLGIIIGSTSNTLAETIVEKVEAVYSSFNFVVNGESEKVETSPLVVNGTSYLPVRSVANMLGYDVTYKAESKTIEFNNSEYEGDLMSQIEEITVTEYKELKAIKVNGETYFSLRDYSLKFAPISWGYDKESEVLFLAKYKGTSDEIVEVYTEVNKNDPNVFASYKGLSYINISYYQEIQ